MPAAIVPAELAFKPDGTPYAPQFDDVYHSASGALEQAHHVFLRGNGLPARWAGRPRFVILETGFGLGNNFLATWAAWRDDPQRSTCLVFISVEKHPLRAHALADVHRTSPLHGLAAQLVAQWPPLTPNVHRLAFEAGRVELLLALGEVGELLPQLQAQVDAVFLDGFAPARNAAMWHRGVFKRIARLAAPGATAATWSTARVVRDGLAQAGFRVSTAPGFRSKRDMTVAAFAPHHQAPPPMAFLHRQAPASALIVGAGLAGSAAAWALAEQGWSCTVLDALAAPAQAASSQTAGIFHGTFNAPDSVHAWWHRAAALMLQRVAAPLFASAAVTGSAGGLLRLEPGLSDAAARQRWTQVGLPASYLEWLDSDAASDHAGVRLSSGGWLYPGGGWLVPSTLVQHWLAVQPQPVHLGCGAAVAQISRHTGQWQALDAAGAVLGAAPVLVLACGMQVNALLGSPQLLLAKATLPLQSSRGQTTTLGADTSGLQLPRVPLAGQGYAVALPEGSLLLGSTTHADDMHAQVRGADHQHNLRQAALLGVLQPQAAVALQARAATLQGRVGWRASTPDRLPLVGPIADIAAWHAARAAGHRADALHHLPRHHDGEGGLYVFTGLGSRGITHAALGARLLAAWITGAPFPVEAALRDALDPARFVLRRSHAAQGMPIA